MFFKRTPQKKRNRPFVNIVLLCLLLLSLFGILVAIKTIYVYSRDLPSIAPLEEYGDIRYWEFPSKVYSINDELIAQFYTEKRELVKLSDVPDNLIYATIATEDKRFYRHKGIDLLGIIRAALVNIRERRIREGASTITQQLAKVLFLTQERTFSRKIKEILLALKIERRYTKNEILERYYNKIYFGHGVYGVEAASRFYFGKRTKELSLAECALLAGLPKAPNHYSPLLHPKNAIARQRVVLKRMVKEGYITEEDAVEANAFTVEYLNRLKKEHRLDVSQEADYFVEYIRRRIEQEYGSALTYKGGLKIYTTLDLDMQRTASKVLLAGLKKQNQNKKNEGRIEGAMVVVDPNTGYIKAMVGGSGFRKDNQMNRAVQAKRQPGSAFKPFLYAAAIDSGFTPASIVVDSPVVFMDHGREWAPKNYDETFHGPVTLRKALAKSINVASVKLMDCVTPKKVVRYARELGIKSVLYPTISLALGTSEVTPLEITIAYCPFANGGFRVDPISIRYIKDRHNRLIKKTIPKKIPVLNPQTAYILTNMMMDVIKKGTAYWSVGRFVDRPCAGKTGTTNNYSDAWFVGYTPEVIATVWIGYDEGRISLGRGMTGGVVGAPIWREFILEAFKDVPYQDFPIPNNIVFRLIDEDTGLLATEFCPKIINEVFIAGTEPTQRCVEHEIESLIPHLNEDKKEGFVF